MEPSKRITDPSFKYINAASTDVRKTFAKARRDMAKAAAEKVVPANVLPLASTKRA